MTIVASAAWVFLAGLWFLARLYGTFYAAVRTDEAGRAYVQDFIELLRSTCRDDLRGITLLS